KRNCNDLGVLQELSLSNGKVSPSVRKVSPSPKQSVPRGAWQAKDSRREALTPQCRGPPSPMRSSSWRALGNSFSRADLPVCIDGGKERGSVGRKCLWDGRMRRFVAFFSFWGSRLRGAA